KDGKVSTFEVRPEQVGLRTARLEDLLGGDGPQNAVTLRAVLDGRPGAFRDIVLLSSAAALLVAGKATTLADGIPLAAAAIDSGKAREKLEALIRVTNEAVEAA